jgi:ribosome-associated protein
MSIMTKARARETAGGETTLAAREEDARTFAIAAARIAREHKTENINVLDLRGISTLADYFVIGTGTSSRQMHAVLDYVMAHARTVGRRHFNIGDSSDATWLLADYVDVVIHLFDEERRNYYDLDGLWGDAPQVDWQPATNGLVNPDSAALEKGS